MKKKFNYQTNFKKKKRPGERNLKIKRDLKDIN